MTKEKIYMIMDAESNRCHDRIFSVCFLWHLPLLATPLAQKFLGSLRRGTLIGLQKGGARLAEDKLGRDQDFHCPPCNKMNMLEITFAHDLDGDGVAVAVFEDDKIPLYGIDGERKDFIWAQKQLYCNDNYHPRMQSNQVVG